MSFDALGLGPEILAAVADAGYTEPTPIQVQAIPIVLQGRDVLGCAQTGTGKTASFTLPMIEVLSAGRARARMPGSLILTPTRELATQIAQNFEVYGKYHKLSMALLIGGVSLDEQKRRLDRGVDVLIATPGRLLDLFERGSILMSGVKILVIDEADRMLDMGFIPDVERIVGLLPPLRQTLMFSATLFPEIRRLADAFLISPKEITVTPPAKPAETVIQSLVVVPERDKRKALRTLLQSEDVENALIFCNRKKDVDLLNRSLRRYHFSSAALHGDMAQSSRTETLAAFKAGDIKLLVATDVAGRGLDIVGLSHVFNFDVPIHAENYVHRIGRTGRAGREGRSVTLAGPEDGRYLNEITKLIGKPIPTASIDGMEATALDPEARKPGRSRRSRKPKPEPGPTAAAAEPAEADKPETRPKPAKPRSKAAPKPKPASKDKPKRSGRAKDADGPVIGMGDHVPAFMRAPRRATG
jgi:superfamily II DNA/RNA helicase